MVRFPLIAAFVVCHDIRMLLLHHSRISFRLKLDIAAPPKLVPPLALRWLWLLHRQYKPEENITFRYPHSGVEYSQLGQEAWHSTSAHLQGLKIKIKIKNSH